MFGGRFADPEQVLILKVQKPEACRAAEYVLDVPGIVWD